jgi:hypothetical protein
MQGNRLTAALGLCWPRQALPVLKQQMILVPSSVRLQRQYLASGCLTFTHEDGQPIEWVHPVKAIGANGPHTVVVVPVFSRQSVHCAEFPAAAALCTGPAAPSVASATTATVNQAIRNDLAKVAR